MNLFLTTIITLTVLSSGLTTDNICSFRVGGRLFSLKYLQRKDPYVWKESQNDNKEIMFNFCQPFVPDVCVGHVASAYSFMVVRIEKVLPPKDIIDEEPKDVVVQSEHYNQTEDEGQGDESESVEIDEGTQSQQDQIPQQQAQQTPENLPPSEEEPFEQDEQEHNDDQPQQIPPEIEYEYTCIRYSSNQFSHLFLPSYQKIEHLGQLQMILETESRHESFEPRRHTKLQIKCTDEEDFQVKNIYQTNEEIVIEGESSSGCPIFQVSSLWTVVEDHYIIFGLVLMVIGFHSLFFGRIALEITIFTAGFFVCMAILGSLLTVFIGPNSKPFVVYLSFILLLLVCTLLSYGITRLVDISLFFVGAWLGLIVGVLINSLFAKMFHIYSVWSLVVFVVLCAIPLGLLTFKYRNQIIIVSTSITGAYLIIRPISWVAGGFPNEFLLYHLIETNQLKTLPWTFFLYLIFIIALAIVGGMYQLLKLQKEQPSDQLQINFIQETIEGPIDRVKLTVEGLIDRYRPEGEEDQYERMKEMETKKNDKQNDF